ncbi:MAG: LacI family DNA-binding transcriptional regulator [Pseudomonadota bacterium]
MTDRQWKGERVTIKDIARAANVDPSTVTRALQGSERVRQSTRERIAALAEEMGYVPNQAARTLVTSKSQLIGLVIPDLTNPFFAALDRGIEEEAGKHGFKVMIRNTNGDTEAEREAIRFFTAMKVDGIVAAMARCSTNFYGALQAAVPIVHVNRDDLPHHVCCDREAGTYGIIEHLIELGHRRIAYVTGPGPASSPKYNGFKRALAAHGLSYEPERTLRFNGELQDCEHIAAQLLAIKPRPTAIFAWNDQCAIGLHHALRERGVRVPEDLSIAGHDDIAIAPFVEPALTTVHWPMYELGQASIRYLYRLRDGQRVRRPRIPAPTVKIRASTAPPQKNRGG